MHVLLVDGQRTARLLLLGFLRELPGVTPHEAESLEAAREVLRRQPVDVALIDSRLSEAGSPRDGQVLVEEVRQTGAVPVVVTSSGEQAELRAAMRLGAQDFLVKDGLSEDQVASLLEQLRARRRPRAAPERGPELIGASPALRHLCEGLRRVARSERPVLVTGPTGAGKEMVVRALHAQGPAPEEPLLDVNCGAIPEALMESQLFGHERGAFTGADRRHEGYLAAARAGTLFLDEVAELPLALQAKLLRVLETGFFRPVGANEPQRLLARVVAATHVDLEERVADGRFREDLLYRLNVLELRVPSLEERREDIPALVAHFAQRCARPLRFTPEALDALARRPWPGNIRQLRNLVDRLCVFAEDERITPEALERLTAPRRAPASRTGPQDVHTLVRALLRLPLSNKLETVERLLIEEAMVLAEGNKSEAARLLGVHRKAIERRVAQREPSDDSDS